MLLLLLLLLQNEEYEKSNKLSGDSETGTEKKKKKVVRSFRESLRQGQWSRYFNNSVSEIVFLLPYLQLHMCFFWGLGKVELSILALSVEGAFGLEEVI